MMPNLNESFIHSIFKAMIEVKPKLAYFISSEDEEEEVDVRKLASEIISHYPWPIGIELRRLLSNSMLQLDRNRLDQIFKTFERTVQFVSFVLLSQLVEECLNKQINIPKGFKKEFKGRISTMTMGNFVWLIQNIGSIFQNNQIHPFLPLMSSIFNSNFYRMLDFWTPLRNEMGHYQIKLTDEEIEVRCGECLNQLETLLNQLAFLIKYPLITITEIKVDKPKRREALYHHRILMLNSHSSDFDGKFKQYNAYTDSHSVLLVKNMQDAPSQYLSLSPLIVDTHTEAIDSREKLKKIRKDIYLFTKWKAEKKYLYYIGTEAEEKVDLKLLSYYDQLVSEFEEILMILG